MYTQQKSRTIFELVCNMVTFILVSNVITQNVKHILRELRPSQCDALESTSHSTQGEFRQLKYTLYIYNFCFSDSKSKGEKRWINYCSSIRNQGVLTVLWYKKSWDTRVPFSLENPSKRIPFYAHCKHCFKCKPLQMSPDFFRSKEIESNQLLIEGEKSFNSA